MEDGIVKSITPVRVNDGICEVTLKLKKVKSAEKNEEYKIFIFI